MSNPRNVPISSLKPVIETLSKLHSASKYDDQGSVEKADSFILNYLEPKLGFILKEYLDQDHPLVQFPYPLFECETLQEFLLKYEGVVVPTLLWTCPGGQEEKTLNEVAKIIPHPTATMKPDIIQEFLTKNFAIIHSFYLPIIAAKGGFPNN